MTYITNKTSIVLILSNGDIVTVDKTEKQYPKILESFSLPEEEQEEAVKKIVNEIESAKEVLENTDGFEIEGDSVFYDGERLPKAMEEKVISIVEDGLPLKHFENFWKRLAENPSAQSVEELMDFLSYKELPITEDGHFIAYKGVQDDYYSVHGNLRTKVIQGTADGSGRIYNAVGEVIEVLRRCVNDNRHLGCSEGLHVGSLNYATNWGYKTVVVKVDPKDVVSVPTDSCYQKCRVSKYEVVGEYEREIVSSVVSEDGDPLIPDYIEEREDFLDSVAEYMEDALTRNEEILFDDIKLYLRNVLGLEEYVTDIEIIDALQELDYCWDEDERVAYE